MFKKILLGTALSLSLCGAAISQPAPAPIKAATAAKAEVLIADMIYVMEASEAGKFKAAELTKIGQAMDKEIEPKRKFVEDENKKLIKAEADLNAMAEAIRAQGGSAEQSPEFLKKLGEYQGQKTALQKKAQEIALEVQYLKRDLAASEEAAQVQLLKALQPIVKTVVTAHDAKLLLDNNVNIVAYYDPAIDVTDELLAKLNLAAKTVVVKRVVVPREAPKPPIGGGAVPKPAPKPVDGGGALPKKPAAPPVKTN